MNQKCPNCGEWCHAEIRSFQSDTELIGTIAELVSSIETEEDYEQVNELCKKLDSRNCFAAYYWRAYAQYNVARVFGSLWSSFSEEEEDSDKAKEYKGKRLEWFNKAYKTINDSIKLYNANLDFNQDKDGGYAFDFAINLKAWIEWAHADNIDEFTAARNSFIDAMNTAFDDVREDATKGYRQCTDMLLLLFDHFVTVKDDYADFLNDEDEEMRNMAKREIDAAENSKFSNLPYPKRQFIFITKEGANNIAGCTDSENYIRYVFTLDEIPLELTFPVGHPQQNTLYVANPAQKGQYVPFIGAEDKLFHDKVNDFIRLSQCLGATEISFHSIKGKSISQSFLSSTNVSGGVNIIGNSVTGEDGLKNTGNSSYNSSKGVELTRRYDPIKKPYCPDDVEWLSLDPEWQRFVKQRLEGNILESSMRISSSESICSNTNTLRNVKAAFENMMVKVDANYDSEEDNTFSSSESTEWQISVKFRSIRDFTEQCPLPSQQLSSLQLSPAEEKYKEEVLFVLEDGVIGDAERRLLKRKRQKFGVSEERAKLIEESCAPSLSEEEKEYIEIYKDMLEDGEISERRRKILNKEAESLGISQSRAVELEAMN